MRTNTWIELIPSSITTSVRKNHIFSVKTEDSLIPFGNKIFELKNTSSVYFKPTLEIFHKAFPEAYELSKEEVEKLLLSGFYRIFISIKENIVIAGAIIMKLPHFKEFNYCHLDYLFVNKTVQGKGFGTEFMLDLLESLKNVEENLEFMTLECYDELIGFYQKFGALKCKSIKPSQWKGNPKLYNFLIIPIHNTTVTIQKLDLVLMDIRELHKEELDFIDENKFVWKSNLINCK